MSLKTPIDQIVQYGKTRSLIHTPSGDNVNQDREEPLE